MKRIRAALLAAFALVALAVIPASASASAGWTADQYPATLKGTEITRPGTENGKFRFAIPGAFKWAECGNFGLGASINSAVPSVKTSSVKAPSPCSPLFTGVSMNSCQLELDPTRTPGVRVGPPGCGSMTVTVGECHPFSIAAGTEFDATYTNMGTGSSAYVQVVVDDPNVKYEIATWKCGPGTFENLSVKGAFKVTATNAKGESIGTRVTTGGLSIVGMGAGNLTSTSYPYTPVGDRYEAFGGQGEMTLLSTGSGKVTCSSAKFTGSELSGAVGSFTLAPAYSGCKVGANAATVTNKNCYYTFEGMNSTDERNYSTEATFYCDFNDVVTIESAGCKIFVPQQALTMTGAEPAFVSGTPFGDEEALYAGLGFSGVKYTTNKAFACTLAGFGSTGEGTASSSQQLIVRAT